MYLGMGVVFILAFALWLIWSKLCDIEQKQFRIHDEMSLSLKHIEEQLHLAQSMIESIHEDMPPISQNDRDVRKEQMLHDGWKQP